MKAAVCTAYGPPGVVRVHNLPNPVVKPNRVLVRVAAATVSTADRRIRALDMPRGFRALSRLALGFSGPRLRVLGTELSGVVVETGRCVSRFRPGDAVVAYPGAGLGCHAEYRVLPEDGPIIAKPESLSHAQAAGLCFGGVTALAFLRDKGRIQPGHRVLVIGASGSVGSAAVQIAKAVGAEVTALCSGENRELVTELGADRVIDYRTEDFTNSGVRYDLILDSVGAETFGRARSALTPHGRFLAVAADLPQMLQGLTTIPRRQKLKAGMIGERVQDMQFLAEMVRAGTLRPIIDSVYPLDEIAAAHARVDTARKRGNVVVTMQTDAS